MFRKIACAATIAAMVLVSQAAFAGTVFPKVVVAPSPLKPYVDAILHGHGEAADLLRPGQDPHSFSLAPSQAQALDGADVLIVPNLAMSPLLASVVAKKKKLRVIELSALPGASPLPYAEINPWLASMRPQEPIEHTHDAPSDPHLWLDPERMAAIARPLADAMAEALPEAQAGLKANATALARHLRDEVIPALRVLLDKPVQEATQMGQAEIPFITYHAAYQYFLERFELTHYGEVTQRPAEMLGTKSMTALLKTAEQQRVRCLIGEEQNTLIQRIAKSTGARVVLLNPEQLPDRRMVDALDWIQNDYDRFLYATAKAFAGCL